MVLDVAGLLLDRCRGVLVCSGKIFDLLFVVSVRERLLTVCFLLELMDHVDIVGGRKHLHDEEHEALDHSEHEGADADVGTPGGCRLDSREHIRHFLLRDVVVDALSTLCNLAPTVDGSDLRVESLTRKTLDVSYCTSKLLEDAFLIGFRKVSHVRRQNLRHTADVSRDDQETAASSLQDRNAE